MEIIKNEFKRIAGLVNSWFVSDLLPNITEENVRGNMKMVQFFWGHPTEIVDRLIAYGKDEEMQMEKYPIIMLFLDIPVFKGKYGDFDGTLLEIVIANSTLKDARADDREIINFIPILRPIYAKLMEEIEQSNMFTVGDPQVDMRHTYTEKYYWGKAGLYGSDGIMTTDRLDAIHIKDLDLKINLQNC